MLKGEEKADRGKTNKEEREIERGGGREINREMRREIERDTLIKYKTIKTLFVIYIGEKSNQNTKFNSLFDIIIITSININLKESNIQF